MKTFFHSTTISLIFLCILNTSKASYNSEALKDIHPDQKALIDSSTKNAIAKKYKGDKGIEKDPDVIFVENFDEGSLSAVKSRWESVKNIESMYR